MLLPAYAHLLTYFYPIGNTPAVCLTQNLPLEKQANILLLGCGDVRSILFTARSDGKRIGGGKDHPSDIEIDRPMDITSCDIEEAVIGMQI
jgi:hypothetical protein